jgi:hypothetical protein
VREQDEVFVLLQRFMYGCVCVCLYICTCCTSVMVREHDGSILAFSKVLCIEMRVWYMYIYVRIYIVRVLWWENRTEVLKHMQKFTFGCVCDMRGYSWCVFACNRHTHTHTHTHTLTHTHSHIHKEGENQAETVMLLQW